jgi:hypothetical protein
MDSISHPFATLANTDLVHPHLHAYPRSTYITDLGLPLTFTFSDYTIFSYLSVLLLIQYHHCFLTRNAEIFSRGGMGLDYST